MHETAVLSRRCLALGLALFVAVVAPSWADDAPSGLGAFEALGDVSGALTAPLRGLVGTLTGAQEDPGEGDGNWKFFGNPDDVDEMGNVYPFDNRIPVVVVHGYSQLYVKMMSLAGQMTWKSLRNRLKRDRARGVLPGTPPRDGMKFFFYYYQPTKPYPDLAREFAGRLAEGLFPENGWPEGTEGPRKILILAHSAGALMARYASVDPRLQDRVHGIVTLAGAHRGSIQASLATAHALDSHPDMSPEMIEVIEEMRKESGLDRRVYSSNEAVRMPCEEDARCRVLTSLAYDNYDGAISAEMAEAYGIHLNEGLRQFNERAPSAEKIVAFHGDVTDLGTRRRTRRIRERGSAVTYRVRYTEPSAQEKQRAALGAFFPAWGNSDPVIHIQSGAFADSPRPLRQRILVENMAHTKIFGNSKVITQVLETLRTMAAEVQAENAEIRALEQTTPSFGGITGPR